MNCNDVQLALSAFGDGELPGDTAAVIARHLEGCARCRGRQGELLRLALLVRAAPQPPPPDELEDRVRRSLSAGSGAGAGRLATRGKMLAASLASAAAAAVVTVVILGRPAATGDSDPRHDVLAAHVRTLLDERDSRVRSGDPHAVRPWFAGRLPFAPPTPDFSAEGFPLTGGRLEYIGGRWVAAVGYRRRQHEITVFVWPADSAAATGEASAWSERGFNLLGWRREGLDYVAVSDLNAEELRLFRSLYTERLDDRR